MKVLMSDIPFAFDLVFPPIASLATDTGETAPAVAAVPVGQGGSGGAGTVVAQVQVTSK